MSDFEPSELIGAFAALLSVAGQCLYIFSVVKGRTTPHMFTWIVWGLLGSIGFWAQYHGGAGPGAWALGASAFLCFLTAGLAVRFGEKNITQGDKIALAASALAVMPWALTDSPVGSVIMISLINLAGFYPTIRKSWSKPGEEILTSYVITAVVMALSLLALDRISLTTALYPATVVSANILFLLMCVIRRRQLSP